MRQRKKLYVISYDEQHSSPIFLTWGLCPEWGASSSTQGEQDMLPIILGYREHNCNIKYEEDGR